MNLRQCLDKFKSDFILQSHRMESFKNHWPYDDNQTCNVEKMAEAGFYWTGNDSEPDTATCFICKKTLDGWESTDDPWKEHTKHAPNCLFVQIGCKESLLTLQNFLDIYQAIITNKVTSISDNKKKEYEAAANEEKENFCSKK